MFTKELYTVSVSAKRMLQMAVNNRCRAALPGRRLVRGQSSPCHASSVSEMHHSVVSCSVSKSMCRHTIGRARFSFGLKRGSPIRIVRTQLPRVHTWALTINRSQGQTLDRVLLDLRRAPFAHGQAYVAISRVHEADECGAFVDDDCCVERDSRRCAVLGSVAYSELLVSSACAIATALAPAGEPTPMDICGTCEHAKREAATARASQPPR